MRDVTDILDELIMIGGGAISKIILGSQLLGRLEKEFYHMGLMMNVDHGQHVIYYNGIPMEIDYKDPMNIDVE